MASYTEAASSVFDILEKNDGFWFHQAPVDSPFSKRLHSNRKPSPNTLVIGRSINSLASRFQPHDIEYLCAVPNLNGKERFRGSDDSRLDWTDASID
jgi:hypothetical protein